MSAITWALTIGGFAFLGLLVLIFGLPAASKKQNPWQWRLGIVVIALGFICWPPVYAYLSNSGLEMVWMVIWFATFFTFGWGAQVLLRASKSDQQPLRFQWTLNRDQSTNQRTPALHQGSTPDAEHRVFEWSSSFQWGNGQLEEVRDEEDNDWFHSNESLPEEQTRRQIDPSVICAWCGSEIGSEAESFRLGVTLKNSIDLESERGKVISFKLPHANRTIPAVVPVLGSKPGREGNHLVFSICSQGCSHALKAVLNHDPDLAARVQQL